jgi:hypothetical protein
MKQGDGDDRADALQAYNATAYPVSKVGSF